MSSSSPIKILLVEDSPSDAALLQESLHHNEPGRFKFTQAETLAQALELLKTSTFDLMLLDLSLPDSIGQATYLRAREAAPQLPIVVLTGIENESVGLEAVRRGVQDYLIKGQAYGRQTARAILYAIERKRTEEALKQAEAALQRERDQLEGRIKERTAELLNTNLALQAEIKNRLRAEEAHQQVLRRLSEAQETERGRISRELHDRLGQDLTALKLGLQILHKHGPFTGAAQDTVTNLDKLADGLMRDIHRLAWELRPSALDDLGLEMALQRYASEWSEASGIRIDFHTRGLNAHRLPLEFETALYRVTQEALTNVLRHAKAKRVSVLLERRPGLASLIVEDDGEGFDLHAVLDAPATRGRLGLLGMQERVNVVGGTLDIESSPGQGTTIFVRLPLVRQARPGQNPMPA